MNTTTIRMKHDAKIKKNLKNQWWPREAVNSTNFYEDGDYLDMEEIFVAQHGDVKRTRITHAQSVRQWLISSCKKYRWNAHNLPDMKFFCRRFHLPNKYISFRLGSSAFIPDLKHPPIVDCGYFPITCSTDDQKMDYLMHRYLNAVDHCGNLIPYETFAIENKNMKIIPAICDVIWEFHEAGRHIHGFFFFVSNGERTFLAEMFNCFMFPIDIPYSYWDLKLKIAFDRVSVYNLHLFGVLERNTAIFKKIGPQLYEHYDFEVFFNPKGKLHPFWKRKCEMLMANNSLLEGHNINTSGTIEIDQYVMVTGPLEPPPSSDVPKKKTIFSMFEGWYETEVMAGRQTYILKNEAKVRRAAKILENMMNLIRVLFEKEKTEKELTRDVESCEPSVSGEKEPEEVKQNHQQSFVFGRLVLVLLKDKYVKEMMKQDKENVEIFEVMLKNIIMEHESMVETVGSEMKKNEAFDFDANSFLQEICKALQYNDNDFGKYWKFNSSVDNGAPEQGDLEESKLNKRKAPMDSEVPAKKARKAPASRKRRGRPRKRVGAQKENVPEAKKNLVVPEDVSEVPHLEDVESTNGDKDQNPEYPAPDPVIDDTVEEDPQFFSKQETLSKLNSVENAVEDLELLNTIDQSTSEQVGPPQNQKLCAENLEWSRILEVYEIPDQIESASEGKDSSEVDGVPAELPQDLVEHSSQNSEVNQSDAPEAPNSEISSNQSKSDSSSGEEVSLPLSVVSQTQIGTSDAPDQDCTQDTSRSASEMVTQEPAHYQDSENDPVPSEAAVNASHEPKFLFKDVEPIASKSDFEVEPAYDQDAEIKLALEVGPVSPEAAVVASQDGKLELAHDQDSKVVKSASEVVDVASEAAEDVDNNLDCSTHTAQIDLAPEVNGSSEAAEDVVHVMDGSTHPNQIDLAPEVIGSPEAAVIVEDAVVPQNSDISRQDSEVEVAQLQNSSEALQIVDAQEAQDRNISTKEAEVEETYSRTEYLQLNPAHLQLLANFRLRNIFSQFTAEFSTIPEVEASTSEIRTSTIVDDVIIEHDQEAPTGLSTQGTSSEIRSFSEVVEHQTSSQSDQDISKKKLKINNILEKLLHIAKNREGIRISRPEADSDEVNTSEERESSTSHSEDQDSTEDMDQVGVSASEALQEEKSKIPKLKLRRFNQYWKIVSPEESDVIIGEAEDLNIEETEENPTCSSANFENDVKLDFHQQHLARRAQMVSQGGNAQDTPKIVEDKILGQSSYDADAPNPTPTTSNDDEDSKLDFHQQHIRHRASIVSKKSTIDTNLLKNPNSTSTSNANDVFRSVFSFSPDSSL